nr:hypothetical protein Itr_chr14CG03230 [Ipomoea trifida]
MAIKPFVEAMVATSKGSINPSICSLLVEISESSVNVIHTVHNHICLMGNEITSHKQSPLLI